VTATTQAHIFCFRTSTHNDSSFFLHRGSRVLELLQEEAASGSPLVKGAMEGLLGRVQVGREVGREGG